MDQGDMQLVLQVIGDSSSAQQSIRDYAAATQKYTQDIARQYQIQSQAATTAAHQIKTEMSQALGQIDLLQKGLARGTNAEWAQQAIPEVERYKQRITELGEKLREVGQQGSQSFFHMTGQEYKAYAGAELLGRDMGVYLPYQASRLIAKSEALAAILPMAFDVGLVALFVEQLVKAAENFHVITDWVVGYTKAEQQLFKQQGEFNQQLLSRNQAQLQKDIQANVQLQTSLRKQLAEAQRELALVPASPYGPSPQEATLLKQVHDLTAALKGATDQQQKLNLELGKLQQSDAKKDAARYVEVLRAQADALNGTGNKVGALRLQLKALALEEKAALDKDTGDMKALQYDHEYYAARRIEIEHQLTAAVAAATKKREAAKQREAHEVEQLNDRISKSGYRAIEEMNKQGAALLKSEQKMLAEQQEFAAHIEAQMGRINMRNLEESSRSYHGDMQRSASESARKYLQILQMEPAALAAVARAYPGLTVAQMAMLPAIKQITQAWKDQDVAMKQSLTDSLNRLSQFEQMLPELAEQYDVAFSEMTARQQEFTLAAVHGADVIVAAINRELMTQRSLGPAMRSALAEALAAEAQHYAKKAEIHAKADMALAIEALASLQFAQAAEYFAAAAAWGALAGGISALGGMAAGAIEGGSRGGGGRSHGPAAVERGYSTPQGPQSLNTGPMLHITMIGEQEAGAWIAQTLTSGVQAGRFQLASSSTMSTPIPRA